MKESKKQLWNTEICYSIFSSERYKYTKIVSNNFFYLQVFEH